MTLSVRILGCGSSAGVPRVAQGWGVCDPNEPRNRRRRCSILVERAGAAGRTTVLVDTSPDLREQLLEAQVSRLDAILMTHGHADHTHGIDDVRPIVHQMCGMIDIHMDEPTSSAVTPSFRYIFETPPGSQYSPLLRERRITAPAACDIDGPGGRISATPIVLDHGEIRALGFRIDRVAYTPDFIRIPPDSVDQLRDLDLWIIDALRYKPHPTHCSIGEALDWIAKLRPRRAVLTNMSSEVDYATLSRALPPGVEAAYDGLQITL